VEVNKKEIPECKEMDSAHCVEQLPKVIEAYDRWRTCVKWHNLTCACGIKGLKLAIKEAR